jgi:hypothetical protein
MLSDERFKGKVVEWKGKYGWIVPAEAIDHPEASLHSGRIFLSADDVEEEIQGSVGCPVSFLCYSDGTGLGAASCRPVTDDNDDGSFDDTSAPVEVQEGAEDSSGDGTGSLSNGPLPVGGVKRPGGALGRTELFGEPVNGRVMKWMDTYGWIRPEFPIEHPAAAAHNGDIYFRQDDVLEDLSGVGCTVQFMPYVDTKGIGASKVRPVHSNGFSGPSMRSRPEALALFSRLLQTEGSRPPLGTAGAASTVHKMLEDAVWEAVEPMAYLEEILSPQELSKRIFMYFGKALQIPQLKALPWRRAVSQFTEVAMTSYAQAYKTRPWFYDMDLSPALASAAWALLQTGQGEAKAESEAEVGEAVAEEYAAQLERARVAECLLDALKETFTDGVTVKKLYNGLNGVFVKTYIESVKDQSASDDLHRAQIFLRRWVEDGVARVWQDCPARRSYSQRLAWPSCWETWSSPWARRKPSRVSLASCSPVAACPKAGRPGTGMPSSQWAWS